MSLSEENLNGLLGTQVTWDDIQQDCYRLWGPEARLGSNKTIRDIADGKGFISRIGVVENTWESPTEAEKNDWPLKFVVKIVTPLQQAKYMKELEEGHDDRKFYDEEEQEKGLEKFRRLHNVECKLYEKFKNCDELYKLKVYVSYPFTEENQAKGYLIMEYVKDVINMGNETYLEEELVDQILDALALHHSMGLTFTEEEKQQFTMGIVTDLFGVMLQEQFVSTCLSMVSTALGDGNTETYDKYKNGVEVLTTKENMGKMDNMAEILGMGKVLCHGDPWTCNIICTEDNGLRKLHALIDYQTSHFGCVGHDLARLLVNVLSYEERKNNFSRYICKYYSRLSEIWASEQKELPFTKEQLITAYKAYLPLTTYVVGVSAAALMETRCKRVDNSEVIREIMKQKVIDLGRNFHESLIHLQSL